MAVVDEHRTEAEHSRQCPECGRIITDERYCPECGHAISPAPSTGEARAEEPTQAMPPPPPGTTTPVGAPPAGDRPRSRLVPIAIAGAVLLAATAAVVIIVLSNSSSNQSRSYPQKLTSALAPVVNANRAMSSALQTVDGSHKTIVAAQNATSQAQSAVVATRGAISVLSAPSSDTTVSQQVQQALTQENGYLQAVSSTLSSPSVQSGSQLQALITSTQSAFVPLASVAPGGQSSLSGTDNLLKWVAGVTAQANGKSQAAQRKAIQQAAAANSQSTAGQSGASSSAGAPSSSPGGLTACDQNISVNSNTSCTFADNVFAQYAQYVQQAGGPGSYYVPAFSSATNQTYTETCNYSPANQIVLCSHGSDLIQFPYWAAEVYR